MRALRASRATCIAASTFYLFVLILDVYPVEMPNSENESLRIGNIENPCKRFDLRERHVTPRANPYRTTVAQDKKSLKPFPQLDVKLWRSVSPIFRNLVTRLDARLEKLAVGTRK